MHQSHTSVVIMSDSQSVRGSVTPPCGDIGIWPMGRAKWHASGQNLQNSKFTCKVESTMDLIICSSVSSFLLPLKYEILDHFLFLSLEPRLRLRNLTASTPNSWLSSTLQTGYIHSSCGDCPFTKTCSCLDAVSCRMSCGRRKCPPARPYLWYFCNLVEECTCSDTLCSGTVVCRRLLRKWPLRSMPWSQLSGSCDPEFGFQLELRRSKRSRMRISSHLIQCVDEFNLILQVKYRPSRWKSLHSKV